MSNWVRPVGLSVALMAGGISSVWAGEGVSGALTVKVEEVVASGTKVVLPPLEMTENDEASFVLAAPEALVLYDLSPGALIGGQVVGASGKTLGELNSVVSDRISGRIYVVISSGGFLGFGESRHTVPLDDLRLREGDLHLAMTESELQMSKQYTDDRYTRVSPDDRPISQFSAFETTSR
ncbi:PRC-barrel domain-containing protein [Marinobacterium lutimaris]|uniref:PRC-barrel domain-containing protein n=1 Tax=Marinobacterium lutimaris TaxID=568106 RepID=A0A1H6APX4_9GAMM|nr:PRC-barrel domain-containing protein [Marinobacterium lutimaris]SEG50240.1 PRC-barrel domain-containing protein [Marinobacterium lutimaris]